MPGFNISVGSCSGPNAVSNSAGYNGAAYAVETARNHRFRLEVLEPFDSNARTGPGSNSILLHLAKCTRPSPIIDEIPVHHGQDVIYRPGKNTWNPIDFTFYEVLVDQGGRLLNTVADKIFTWWGQVKNGQGSVLNLARSSLGTKFYRNAELAMLDGTGNSVWGYRLYNCWPFKVSPSDLDYSSSEIAEITVSLRFNKAYEENFLWGAQD